MKFFLPSVEIFSDRNCGNYPSDGSPKPWVFKIHLEFEIGLLISIDIHANLDRLFIIVFLYNDRWFELRFLFCRHQRYNIGEAINNLPSLGQKGI